LKVFKQILEDLDEISCQEGNETSKNIVSNIVATKSDRAATEVKFNNFLHQFRKDVLPLTYLYYNSFTGAEKSALENMCNFFCGLHALVNFSEASRLCIKENERRKFDGNVHILSKHEYDSDPGVIKLVIEASKAFGGGPGGDQKSFA
jgi:E1A/CREB-binding protein